MIRTRQNLLILLFFGLVWSLAWGALFLWNLHNERQRTRDIVLQEARAFSQQILTTRDWNASHGGVYVPVTDLMQPNQYLFDPGRDVVTTSGLTLTKINPAFMTRQLADFAGKKNNVQFNITSLKPVRPENSPDPWEAEALHSFERGEQELFDFTETPDGKKLFRYMAALFVEESCLACHARYGSREGEVRGGVSVTIPIDMLTDYHYRKLALLIVVYGFVWLSGLVATNFGLKSFIRKMEIQQKDQMSAILLAEQERERKRIGRELHDSLGQSLSAIKFGIENELLKMQQKNTAQDTDGLKKIVPRLQEAIEEVRRIVMDLWPSTLDDLGLIATLSWFSREFESIYAGIRIEQQLTLGEDAIPKPLKIAIFRIVQEALNNIAKHSNADRVSLRLGRTGHGIELRIEDNGPAAAADGGKGFGIISMQERAELSGGKFAIVFVEGKGTCVQASWPLPSAS
ncbi:DUF3365 domain-containing protein [Thermodesulfobacteriota bacterium]